MDTDDASRKKPSFFILFFKGFLIFPDGNGGVRRDELNAVDNNAVPGGESFVDELSVTE